MKTSDKPSALDKIFTEEQVQELSKRVIDHVDKKLKDEVLYSLYNELDSYLWQHYENHKEKVEATLIDEITDRFKSDPDSYKYKDLRKRLWEENKEALTKKLTDEAIQECVENVILDYTHREYHFNHMWLDGIAKVIFNNWDRFKEDARIQAYFGRKMDQKDYQYKKLSEELEEAIKQKDQWRDRVRELEEASAPT